MNRVSISPMSQSNAGGVSLNSAKARFEANVDLSRDINMIVAFLWASSLKESSPTTTINLSDNALTLEITSKGLKPGKKFEMHT